MWLARFDTETFLRDFWQKQPLLIRNPWDRWTNPLDPDELAGLACEEGVEARLVVRTRDTWKAEHGPFAESRFARLGKDRWTLLVQAVDHHVPDVAALVEPFRFVPDWRIDDVMVSYAADEGGVGPHFDQYDVFLIQGLGRRKWRLGGICDAGSALMPHDDLRLLADFAATEQWVLEPGDILYVPPGVAHDGIAMGDDCMTYSVGFRAPARSELIAHWCDHVLADLPDDDRYVDPGLQAQANPGEIGADALAALQAMVTEALGDSAAFARWFGRYSTARKYPEVDWRPDEAVTAAQVRRRVTRGEALRRNPASRFAFVRRPEGAVWLFVDGECFACEDAAARVAEALCAREGASVAPGLVEAVPAAELLAELINRGSLAFELED